MPHPRYGSGPTQVQGETILMSAQSPARIDVFIPAAKLIGYGSQLYAPKAVAPDGVMTLEPITPRGERCQGLAEVTTTASSIRSRSDDFDNHVEFLRKQIASSGNNQTPTDS